LIRIETYRKIFDPEILDLFVKEPEIF